jgi:hypothetical protein
MIKAIAAFRWVLVLAAVLHASVVEAASPVLLPPHFPIDSRPGAFTTADLDGDQKLDLVVPEIMDWSVAVFTGDGRGGFSAPDHHGLASSPNAVVSGDLNQDGNEDLVVVSGSGEISVLLGNGAGGFQPEQRYSAGSQPATAVVADFNGDTNLDVATVNTGSDDVTCFSTWP